MRDRRTLTQEDYLVSLMHHDLSDLGLICSVYRNAKSNFGFKNLIFDLTK